MKVRVAVCAALAASIAVFTISAQEKPSAKKPASFWMKKKLEYSEKILEGLAKADFAEIEANAKLMNALSSIEEFVRGRDETYTHHLRAFEHATGGLIRQSKQENIDGAALAYMELTLSCVNCHKHIRDKKEPEPER
jgi:uncharacterized secreted protein with C-terminal beta-propeller domain